MTTPALVAGILELRARAEVQALVQRMLGCLFPAQRQVIDGILAGDVRRVAALCGRRAGKSTLVAVTLCVLCLSHPGGECLWLGLSGDNIRGIAEPILAKVKRWFGLTWQHHRGRDLDQLKRRKGSSLRSVQLDTTLDRRNLPDP